MEWFIHVISFLILVSQALSQDPTVQITETQPRAIKNGRLIEVERSQDVTMDCFVENKLQGTTIRWNKIYFDITGKEQLQKISDDLSVEDNTKNSIEKPTQFTWRLRLRNVQLTDAGKYTCFVYTTQDNRKDANMTVEVKISPYLDNARTSNDITARAGENVELFCNATGLPPPTIEWSRLGGGRLPIGKEVHYESKMMIYDIKAEDRGKYRCQAYNLIGNERMIAIRDITLSVKFKPIVTATHSVVKQAVGYLIELQCLVEMNPYPNQGDEKGLFWVKGGRIISTSIGPYEVKSFRGAFNKLFFDLIINGVEESDYGMYKCQVKNTEGTGAASVELKRTDTPQPSYKIGVIKKGGASIVMVSISTFTMCITAVILHVL